MLEDDSRSQHGEPMPAVVRSPKLTEVVADMLRRKIVTGELAEGDFLPPEPELVAQLGVSRPTVREALRVLESEALIEPRRGSRTGARVRAPSIELSSRYMGFVLQYEGVTLEDVWNARRMVEPPLAAALAARKDPDLVAQLRVELANEASCLGDDIAYGHASVRFHERVAELAGLQTLAMCVKQFNWVIHRLTESGQRHRANTGFSPNQSRSHDAHARLVQMLDATDDPNDVEAFWRSHIDAVGEVQLWGREGDRVLDLFA